MSKKNGASPSPVGFQDAVEQALITALRGIEGLEPTDKIKLLAVASRYVAIRARLVTGEHGSGFEEADALDNPHGEG